MPECGARMRGPNAVPGWTSCVDGVVANKRKQVIGTGFGALKIEFQDTILMRCA